MNILNLPEFEVLDTIQDDHDMTVIVRPVKEPVACPECGGVEYYKHGKSKRFVRDLNSFGKRVGIEIHTHRYKCRYCDTTFSQHYESIDDRDKITIRLREQIEKESLKKPFANIAEEYSVSPTTVKRIFNAYIERLEKDMTFLTPVILGIDEAHLNKSMRAVYTDIIGRKVLDIQPSRKKSDVKDFLSKLSNKENIEVVTIDMWRYYKEAVYEELPKAQVIVDRFHVIQLVNNALEGERKAFKGSLDKKRRSKLLKDRFLLLRNKEDLNARQIWDMQLMFLDFPQLKLAYELKEQFRDIYKHDNREDALKAYEDWKKAVPKDMKYYQDVIKTVDNWQYEIFNYFTCRITNAYTESLNNLIKNIEKAGRGYSFEVLRAKVLFGTSATRKPKYTRANTSNKTYTFTTAFSWNDFVGSTKLIEGFGVDIPQLLEVLESDKF